MSYSNRLITLFVCLLIVLSSCSTPTPTATVAPTAPPQPTAAAVVPTSPPTPEATTREITDMLGTTWTVPSVEKTQRIAVLTSPQVLTVYALGAQDKLVAVTNAVKSWPLLTEQDPHLAEVPAVRGGFQQINIEALLQAAPDVCLGSQGDMEVVARNTKIPALQVATNPPGDYFGHQEREVAFFGEVLGEQERAERYIQYLRRILDTIDARISKLPDEQKMTVYVGFNANHLTTYGGDTYMQEWIEAAGCLNAAQKVSTAAGMEGGLGEVQMEQVLAWDPDVIVIDSGDPASLANDPQWSKIKAVQTGKVYRLPVGLFIWNRPSIEASIAVPQWLAVKAYLDEFSDWPLEVELQRMYSEIFGLNLSDEAIRNILGSE